MLVVFCSSRRRHAICALVTGVQTCALPIWTLVEALAEQWRARRSLARQSLGAILKPSSLSRGDLDRCQSTAAAFVRAWRYRNATDQCLVRSIAMRAMLARRGLGSDLVIGVMLDRKSTRLNSSH